MAHRFKLSKDFIGKLATFREALDAFVSEMDDEVARHREGYDGMSERWLEGERASAVDSWLDALDEFKSAFEDAQQNEDPSEEPEYW